MSVVNIMAGRLTDDPESKVTQNGTHMANFSMADNHGKDDQGQDKVTFYRCTAFGKQAEMILASCKKGHRLNVVGRLESRQYTNNAGVAATSLDVTVSEFGFIEPRAEQPAGPSPAQQPGPGPAPQPQPQLQYDQVGNGYQLINNQWVMVKPAAPPAPPQGTLPFAPPGGAPPQRPWG
ncbi:MAG: single-stranded DNA-binding protein [Negativicutes bacterium]|nr:single-stranded DNA-binding protein [Negativicutes bacterium]